MMKRITYILMAAALVLGSCSKEPFSGNGGGDRKPFEDLENVAGEVIVRFDESVADILDELGVGRSVATRSGVNTVDEVLDLIGGYELERVFPVNAKTEQKARMAGLHLWYVVRYSDETPVEEVVARLSKLGEVSAATPNRTIKRAYNAGKKAIPFMGGAVNTHAAALSNDKYVGYQWHIANDGWKDIFTVDSDPAGVAAFGIDEAVAKAKFVAGCDVGVRDAWNKCKGNPEIIVAVLDEGVDYTHEDLKDNMWVNEGEIWGSMEDNDGNGYAGDVYGYDFINGRGTISTDRVNDTGHGTHVAGVIAAVNNNGKGIASVAGGESGKPGVKIMSCQIFSGDDASNSVDVVRSIKYAADNGAVVLQCSWGYTSGAANPIDWGASYATEEEWIEACPLEKTAMDYFRVYAGSPDGAISGGIPVFASGNEYAPMAGFPGASEGCVSVASIAGDYTASTFTNYGEYTKVAAPGGDQDYYYEFAGGDAAIGADARGAVGCVLSTVPKHVSASGYGYMEGTSMACPHVSGVVALGLSYAVEQRKHFTAEQFLELLYESCTSLDGSQKGNKKYFKYQNEMEAVHPETVNLSKYSGRLGAGLVNASELLYLIDGSGTALKFPNLTIAEGGSVTVSPYRYIDATDFEISIGDASIATVSVSGSSDSSASLKVSGTDSKVTFHALKKGITSATVNGQTFHITVGGAL